MRVIIVLALSAVSLAAQPPTRPSPVQPPRDTRPRPARLNAAGNESRLAVIRGRVVADSAGVSVPLGKARVALTNEGVVVDVMFTDPEGRFEFPALPEGRYTLLAEKTGFARTQFGALRPSDPPSPIEVAAGAVEQVEIRLPKGAAISGRVVDNLGEPVVGARVMANFVQVQGTDRRLVSPSQLPLETDDLGEYRIGGLPAGRYVVSIVPRDFSMFTLPTWGRRVGLGRTFYPSGTTSRGATPIELKAGDERSGIDVTLEPIKPAELSVTIVNEIQEPNAEFHVRNNGAGLRAGSASLTVIPASELGLQGGEPLSSMMSGFGVRGGGSTPPLGIDPGDWIIISRQQGRGAIAHVTLAPGEVAGVTLTLRLPARFSGRLLFEGSTRRPAATAVHIDVIGAGGDSFISPQVLAPGGPFSAKADGTFDVSGILGTVEFLIVPPPGWVVKSMTAGDRDLLDVPVTFEGGETITGVTVVLTDQVAELRGSTFDAEARPSPGCSVAIYQARSNPEFSRQRMLVERADQRGDFRIPDLPPGEYLLMTGPDLNVEDFATPGAFDRFRSAAVSFTLRERETKTVALPCTAQR